MYLFYDKDSIRSVEKKRWLENKTLIKIKLIYLESKYLKYMVNMHFHILVEKHKIFLTWQILYHKL